MSDIFQSYNVITFMPNSPTKESRRSSFITMAEEIQAFQSSLTRTKFLCQDIQDKILNEKTTLRMLRKKVQATYDWIKPESIDLKGKRRVLLKLPKSKKKTTAFSILEEIQDLLDKFNLLRRDLKKAWKSLHHFHQVFKTHAKVLEDCATLYEMNTSGSGSGSEDELSESVRVHVNLSIVRITSSSLPTFDWEAENWDCNAQDLVDIFHGLLVTTRFDVLMKKFDKLLQKLL